MTPDELRTRFLEEIDRRGRDDKYIDGVEERELLQIAVQHGFATDAARQFLTATCQERGYVIEAAVVARIRDKLRSAGADGWLRRAGFEGVVADALSAVSGTTRTDRDVRRLVVTTMEDAGTPRARREWLRDWFRRVKKEVGL
jgi:hypothetical protein